MMKLEFVIKEKSTIKEFIYKNISRNFYGYLKERNARFIVDGILYYDSQNVYLRDKDGNLKSTTRLEAKDIYMLEMLREISIKENN